MSDQKDKKGRRDYFDKQRTGKLWARLAALSAFCCPVAASQALQAGTGQRAHKLNICGH